MMEKTILPQIYTPVVNELFHLLFLRQLETKLDKKLYALKGGCNLRFFFKSIRYSEDINIDVTTIGKTTLENKVNKILTSIEFRRILQSKNIEIEEVRAVKQTETTQRWKLKLRIANSALSIPTTIEFSRRKMDEGVEFIAIDNEIIKLHHLYPIMCNHYVLDTTFSQKVNALINRNVTQARDIFDLKLLLDQGAKLKKIFTQSELKLAIENANLINYEEFKSQVIAFLMEEYKSFYDSPRKWQDLLNTVTNFLRENSNEVN